MVAKEVTAALARLQSATARVSQADRAMRTAIITFNGNFEGLRQTTRFGRYPGPGQPAAGSGLRSGADATGLRRVLHHGRRIQLGAVRAVPRPGLSRPRDQLLRPPGNIVPVETARPEYLPQVGNGPPPATY